jgi:hypothetical protein
MAQPNASKRSLPYAHLLGGLVGRVMGAKADDTTPPSEPKDTDNTDTVDVDELEDEVIENVEDQEDDVNDANGKAKGKAKGTDAGAEDGDDDENKDSDEPAGKRAKRAQDDETDDTTAKGARKVERARCKRIFDSPAAGARPDLAAYLAFDTGMSSASAIALLTSAAAGAVVDLKAVSTRSGLGERMAKQAMPNLGADGGSKPTLAQQIIAVNDRRLGITKK